MKLYHGSTIDIAKVDLALSKPNKDFGRAFYLSDDRQQALEMAQFRAEFEETEPVVNVYEFEETLFLEFVNSPLGAEGVLEGDAFDVLDAAQELVEGDVALLVAELLKERLVKFVDVDYRIGLLELGAELGHLQRLLTVV